MAVNFKQRKEPTLSGVLARLENEVQDEVENQRLVPREVREYAPPAVREVRDVARREEPPINRILSFVELPTKRLDELLTDLQARLDENKKQCQDVRDIYMKHYERLENEARRMEEQRKLIQQTIEGLHDQIASLDMLDMTDPKDAA